MDAELLAAFDALLTRKGYPNRSEGIRDLVRDAIVKTEWDGPEQPTAAVLAIVYDHDASRLPARLTAVQHRHAGEITATLHIHLDARNCLEVLVLRGVPSKLRSLADELTTIRGVKHGQLVMTTTGKHLP
jgi:CopG family nickel-responsive transcriptional regulator